MEDTLMLFVGVLIFAIPVGSALYSLLIGKFPAKGGRWGRNYVVFGDRSVNPELLLGLRARFLSALFILIFGLFIFVLAEQNTLLGNTITSNLFSIIPGIIFGIILCRKMISF